MKKFFAALTVAAVAGFAVAAELKSGPQTGEKVPGPYHVQVCSGKQAGEKTCLYCQNGDNPVAMVFARTADCPQTAKLLQKLDEATVANSKAEMGSFCVFLTDDDKAPAKLKELSEKTKLSKLVLAVDAASGPAKYKIEKDADITVVLYVEHNVKANYSFKKGEIKDADIDAIVKAVSVILPTK